jgi:hypothetical protein
MPFCAALDLRPGLHNPRGGIVQDQITSSDTPAKAVLQIDRARAGVVHTLTSQMLRTIARLLALQYTRQTVRWQGATPIRALVCQQCSLAQLDKRRLQHAPHCAVGEAERILIVAESRGFTRPWFGFDGPVDGPDGFSS